MNVPAEPVELGDGDGALVATGFGESGGELGTLGEGVMPLAGFHFHEFGEDGEAFSLGEPGEGFPLGLDAQTALALLS